MSRRRSQAGQALVEAAFTVPIMVFLVFGTFYITYAYMQRSIMNGAAFMAARAVSVREPGTADALAKTVVSRMAKNAKLGGDHWLHRAAVHASADGGVRMVEPDGMWSFLAKMADSTAGGKGRHQKVAIQLTPEYRRIASSRRSTQTYYLISYSVEEMGAYEATLAFAKLALYSDKDKRIGEPDSTAVTQSTIIGGVDSLGGTQYTRNTSKLDVHKRNIGLRGVPPDDNDSEADPRKQFLPGGPLQKLEIIGKLFDEIQLAQDVAMKLVPQLELAMAGFSKVYGPVSQGRDLMFENGLKFLQLQQTQALTPGAH
jgi:hypothetical protein